MACVAPRGPQMSYAIGPSSDMKHPSNSPIAKAMISRSVKEPVAGRHIVIAPISTNDIC